jgi:hypothetical protein
MQEWYTNINNKLLRSANLRIVFYSLKRLCVLRDVMLDLNFDKVTGICLNIALLLIVRKG